MKILKASNRFILNFTVFDGIDFNIYSSFESITKACGVVRHRGHIPLLIEKRGAYAPSKYVPPEILNSMFLPLMEKAVA